MGLARVTCPFLLLFASVAFGQADRRMLRVKVVDSAGTSLADVRVAVQGSKRTARTDSAGRATLDKVPSGPVFLSVRRLGYVAVDSFPVAPTDSVAKVMLVDQATALDAMRAEAVSPAFAGFEQRRALGVGVFITPDNIKKSRATRSADLFRQVAQVHMVQTTSGEGVRFATSLTSISKVSQITWGISADVCAPMIFIDGQRAPSMEVDDIPLMNILAIEIYRGSAITPPQFVTPGEVSCGAIVIWTKRKLDR